MNNLYHLEAKEKDYDQLNNMLVVASNYVSALRMWPDNKNKGHSDGKTFPFVISTGAPLSVAEMQENVNIELVGITDKPVGTIIIKDY